MKKFPLVSILIVTFNQKDFIEEALNSVFCQDYPEFEVVISDDNSSDGTADIIKKYIDLQKNIKININKKNVGIIENCNRGLNLCSGDFIAFLAGDDIFLPNKIKSQVNWFLENENRVICGHAVEIFDSYSGKILKVHNPAGRNLSISSWIRNGMIISAQSLMVRKSALPVNNFDSRLGIVADWKFVLDILIESEGICGTVPGILSRYRMHGSNISILSREVLSNKFKLSYLDQLITISYFEAFFPRYTFDCKIRRVKLALSNFILAFTARDYRSALIYFSGINPFILLYVLLRRFI